MKCLDKQIEKAAACKRQDCNYWINFPEDLNCTIHCANRNGALTLKEVAKRLGLSHVRIKQIQDKALKKINKKMQKEDNYIKKL
jgi:hypothetical protein|tara:strand:+ start:261 stop:512 length:252 start_codon:yes stop_codon:yes gene_type:complete